MKQVVILESLGVSREMLEELKKPFTGRAEFAEYEKTLDVETLAREAGEADAVILANMPLPGAVIDRCPRLSFIDIAFTGVDHVDIAAARRRGIQVSNASGYSTQAVAELTVGMMLSLLRMLPQAEARARSGGDKTGLLGGELGGKTVGIIGYGKIGRRTGELLRAFGCEILAQCRRVHEDFPDYVAQVSQEELLRRSDIVALHCPLNDSTRGMIDRQKLALMKPTALLINAARGPVVNEADLAQALEDGVIAGAAADVFAQEPPLPADHPLLHAPHTLLTPHIGFFTRESMALRAEIVFDNLRAWLDGEQKNAV